jgi:hypothetical protein
VSHRRRTVPWGLLLGAIAWAAPLTGQAQDDPPPADTGSPPAEADPDPSAEPEASPAPEEPWLELGVVPDFSSAMETGLETDQETGTLSEMMGGLFAAGPAGGARRPAGRWGVRPWLGVQGAQPTDAPGHFGGGAGVRIAHQWWMLTEAPVRLAGETRLQAAGLFGGVSGFDAVLDTLGGAWLGPVGLFGGGMVRADRRSWSPTVSLPSAVGVGPAARVALQLGTLTSWAGVSPAWLVAGDRPGMDAAPWDELSVQGGLVRHKDWSETRLTSSMRYVDDALLWDLTVGFHLRIGPAPSKDPA